eukprot:TRINITY_DN2430_c2_g1_i1.p1 TRINITY_DN2430_c2_g1~~TRINITY_DN2430_c2_g1_i1.p1  ORF type:complete len:610 (+),score=224.16 TRINITY_DN2430_c2_g1_i1:86-1915(+)
MEGAGEPRSASGSTDGPPPPPPPEEELEAPPPPPAEEIEAPLDGLVADDSDYEDDRDYGNPQVQDAQAPPAPATAAALAALQDAYDNLRRESDDQLDLCDSLQRELQEAEAAAADAGRQRDEALREAADAKAAVAQLEQERQRDAATFDARRSNFDHIITVFQADKERQEREIEQLREANADLKQQQQQQLQAASGAGEGSPGDTGLVDRASALEKELREARQADAEEREALSAKLRKREQEVGDLNRLITRKRKQWEQWRDECHEQLQATEEAARQREAALERELAEANAELAALRDQGGAGGHSQAGGSPSEALRETRNEDSIMITMLDEKDLEIQTKEEALRLAQEESANKDKQLAEAMEKQKELAAVLALQADAQACAESDLRAQLERARAETKRTQAEVDRLKRTVFRYESANSARSAAQLAQQRRSPSPGSARRTATASASPGGVQRPRGSVSGVSIISRQTSARTQPQRPVTPSRNPSPARPLGVRRRDSAQRHPLPRAPSLSPHPRNAPSPVLTRPTPVRRPAGTPTRYCTPPKLGARVAPAPTSARRGATPTRQRQEWPASPCRFADAKAGTPRPQAFALAGKPRAAGASPLADRAVNRE